MWSGDREGCPAIADSGPSRYVSAAGVVTTGGPMGTTAIASVASIASDHSSLIVIGRALVLARVMQECRKWKITKKRWFTKQRHLILLITICTTTTLHITLTPSEAIKLEI